MRILHTATWGLAAWMTVCAPAWAANPTFYKDYYEEKLNDGSFASNTRIFQSNLTPSDKFIKVTQVSCLLESSQPLSGVFLSVKATPSGADIRSIQFQPTAIYIGNRYIYSFVQPLEFMIGASRYIHVLLRAEEPSTFANGSCTATGTFGPF